MATPADAGTVMSHEPKMSPVTFLLTALRPRARHTEDYITGRFG